ncbi:MAG: hypothetical protein COB24_08780 [Hyphomicrobiales bacterium]|nr:MAG: hypothetical protein COB24_08780 [Hyphomicrobiales bacterium]
MATFKMTLAETGVWQEFPVTGLGVLENTNNPHQLKYCIVVGAADDTKEIKIMALNEKLNNVTAAETLYIYGAENDIVYWREL